MNLKNDILERFIRYCKIETTSNENSQSCPSTSSQRMFADVLLADLMAIGVEAVVSSDGYVYAYIPSNTGRKTQTVGFIAHMDTAPDFTGKDVNPQVVTGYDGGDICLSDELNIYLKPAEFPELKKYIGNTLITTDGKTLLGADDKAGCAEIITMCRYLSENPAIKHGTITIAFTPDEEIGRGADKFDIQKFNADFAFTIDGGELGELEFENFNAAKIDIEIQGRNIHPGSAKNKMINSLKLAAELESMLPPEETPEKTEGYEGFYHLIKISGDVEKTEMKYILRDHDKAVFENRKKVFRDIAIALNEKYPDAVKITVTDQYYNMKEIITPVKYIIDIARDAMINAGVTPIIKPIRGGTDGAKLSYMGLPCPNIFTGGHNFHGRYEFIPLESMEKSVQVMLKIVELVERGDSQLV